MERTTYIYGLMCPLEEKIRYVGRSVQPVERYRQITGGANGTPQQDSRKRVDWIGALKQSGAMPELVILEEVHSTAEAEAVAGATTPTERKWIDRLYSEGHPLFNRECRAMDRQSDEQIVQEAIERGKQLFG